MTNLPAACQILFISARDYGGYETQHSPLCLIPKSSSPEAKTNLSKVEMKDGGSDLWRFEAKLSHWQTTAPFIKTSNMKLYFEIEDTSNKK